MMMMMMMMMMYKTRHFCIIIIYIQQNTFYHNGLETMVYNTMHITTKIIQSMYVINSFCNYQQI